MKTLKSFSALADFIGDNLSDGPKYCTSLYAQLYAHSSGSGRGVARAYNATIALPRARGTGGKYGCARGRTVYRISITRDFSI